MMFKDSVMFFLLYTLVVHVVSVYLSGFMGTYGLANDDHNESLVMIDGCV